MSLHRTVLAGVAVAYGCLGFASGVGGAADDLQARLAGAKAINAEVLCLPIRTTRGGGAQLVPNPDGKTYDVLLRYFQSYWGPHTTIIIDLGSGEMQKELVPHALFGWGTFGPDGKYYYHSAREGGTRVCVYDPAANATTVLPDPAPVGGEVQPMCVGPDGMIYGGGSDDNTACAYQLDPKTGRITKNYGKMGPSHSPNACWGYSIGADKDHVYIASGKVPWYLVVYDKKTGKAETPLRTDDPRGYIGVSQVGDGCSILLRETGKPDRFLWAHEGKLTEKKSYGEKPPWGEVARPPPPPKPELGLAEAVPKADGKVRIWVRSPEAKAAAPKNPPADATPEQLGWRKIEFEVSTYPTPVLEILALPDGRIFGSGESYTGNFLYDPKAGEARHLGTLPLSQYCMTQFDGVVYMSGYPTSVLFGFDPDQPWTPNRVDRPWDKPRALTDPKSNPRQLTYLGHDGAGTHKMWTATVGADGKVYFGGRWYRNGEGGGLGWWDPAKQKGGGVSETFRNYQINYICPAADARYIVISTNCVRDQAGNTPAPETARLFVFDTTKMTIVRHVEPVATAAFTGAIADAGDGCVLGITFDPADRVGTPAKDANGNAPSYGSFDKGSILYKVNVETGEVLWRKAMPYAAGFRTNENAQGHDGFDFTRGPDGKVWTYAGAKFVRSEGARKWCYSYLNPILIRIDPKDGAVDVVGRLDRGGRMAFVGKDLYLSGGCRYLEKVNHELRVIRSIVP